MKSELLSVEHCFQLVTAAAAAATVQLTAAAAVVAAAPVAGLGSRQRLP